MNIALFLEMAAEACPERTALSHLGKHYSYAELFKAAKRAAFLFSKSNCRFVSLLDNSSPATPVALMGASIAGIPYVPLNYRLSKEQMIPLLDRISPSYLIMGGDSEVYRPDGWTLKNSSDFIQEALSGEETEITWNDDPTAIAVQIFTSGTTGRPKAALLRHEHLVSYILGSVEFMGALATEAALVSVPPYHIAGISAVISNIYACRRIVQLPDFAPDEWLRLLYEENVTSTFLVPTMMTRIIQEIDKTKLDPKNLSSLQSVAYGGGRMPIPVIKRALTLFSDVNFTNAYGLTETSSTISLLNPEDHRAAIDPENETARSKLGSVGKPLPTIEIEIRDNDGLILNPLESGEIYVRGPQVSGEYEGSSVLDSGGWFPTRDAGFLDEEGYLFLSGRADDIIIRGGENISPGEIEDLMHQHLAVSDAAAIGIPSEEWGETVALVIVPLEDKTITEDEIRAHIRKHLRSSRVPEKIFFTSELPYNETGKLLRRAIREWFD